MSGKGSEKFWGNFKEILEKLRRIFFSIFWNILVESLWNFQENFNVVYKKLWVIFKEISEEHEKHSRNS